ncbi:hypothetical protein HK100_003395 [Physocladia obscura]|uniref:Uncharacterized protein n=1 Tax=Physocladia obscura TaxID=109957 RepID=A0AAD5SUG1_9FUNG|nr:hypothetical protein HK100_003395 [Physocladia obscura]
MPLNEDTENGWQNPQPPRRLKQLPPAVRSDGGRYMPPNKSEQLLQQQSQVRQQPQLQTQQQSQLRTQQQSQLRIQQQSQIRTQQQSQLRIQQQSQLRTQQQSSLRQEQNRFDYENKVTVSGNARQRNEELYRSYNLANDDSFNQDTVLNNAKDSEITSPELENIESYRNLNSMKNDPGSIRQLEQGFARGNARKSFQNRKRPNNNESENNRISQNFPIQANDLGSNNYSTNIRDRESAAATRKNKWDSNRTNLTAATSTAGVRTSVSVDRHRQPYSARTSPNRTSRSARASPIANSSRASPITNSPRQSENTRRDGSRDGGDGNMETRRETSRGRTAVGRDNQPVPPPRDISSRMNRRESQSVDRFPVAGGSAVVVGASRLRTGGSFDGNEISRGNSGDRALREYRDNVPLEMASVVREAPRRDRSSRMNRRESQSGERFVATGGDVAVAGSARLRTEEGFDDKEIPGEGVQRDYRENAPPDNVSVVRETPRRNRSEARARRVTRDMSARENFSRPPRNTSRAREGGNSVPRTRGIQDI